MSGHSISFCKQTQRNPLHSLPLKVDKYEVQEQVDRSGQSYCIVHSLIGGTYIKMDAAFFRAFSMMDGRTSLRHIIERVFSERERPATEILSKFLTLLCQNRLIVSCSDGECKFLDRDARGNESVPLSLMAKIGQRVIKCKIAFPYADEFVTRLYTKAGWLFFNRFALLVFSLVVLLGIPLFVVQLFKSIPRLHEMLALGGLSVSTVATLYLGVAVFTALHELGHALACKHYGRKVLSFGLMIYYGSPVCFTDTTDSWMLPKRQRIMVVSAGVLTNVVAGAFCAIVAYVCSSPLVFQVCMIWAAFNFLAAGLNLIPFLKFDGYYILSDWLDKPRLREEAMKVLFCSDSWKNIFRRVAHDSDVILIVYGFCCLAFGTAALALAAISLFTVIGRVVPEPYSVFLSSFITALLTFSVASYMIAYRKRIKAVGVRTEEITENSIDEQVVSEECE